MTVWAIADLHLAFSVPDKKMDFFGEPWVDYTHKIEKHWRAFVKPEDLVLIPGDISWAMNPEEAKIDLDWIHELPGTKVLLKGNHDYWWTSLSKVEKVLPPSMHLVQNNAYHWNDVAVAGTRLWDCNDYQFGPYIDYKENPRANKLQTEAVDPAETERIYARELGRLETSLKAMNPKAAVKIAMLHYPPLSADAHPSRVTALLEKYGVQHCVFGHIHNLKPGIKLFGKLNNIDYQLVAADYLHFNPLKLL